MSPTILRGLLGALGCLRAAQASKEHVSNSALHADDLQQAGVALLQRQLSIGIDRDLQDENTTVLASIASYRQVLSSGCDECIPAVFVVSNGRTGSTSIMHMLNFIPGYDVTGENANMWGSLYKRHAERDSQWKKYGAANLYAWSRSSDGRNNTELLCSLRKMALAEINVDPKAHVVGWKEMRWGFDIGLKDLDLLLEVFPCAKVILNFREDLEAQLRSKMKAFGDFDYYYDETATKEIKNFASKNPDRTFSLALEDFSLERFNDLLRFLGEDADCKYIDVVHDNEGSAFTQTTEPLKKDASKYIQCNGWAEQRARSPP